MGGNEILEENWLTLSSKRKRIFTSRYWHHFSQNGQHSIDPLFTIEQQLEEIMLEANLKK